MASPFGGLVLVANPAAGKGRVGTHLPEVERRLHELELDYRVVRTTGPGDATRATREAIAGGERFIAAVGGDGTVHEVVNGMIGEDDEPLLPNLILGVVAAGSGCDFVRTFGLPGDAVNSCTHLAGSNTFPIDVGKVTYRSESGEDVARYFPNIAEAGLGGSVVARAERLPRSIGRARYFLGFWLTLPGFRRTHATVQTDNKRFEGTIHNVVVANCQFYGGGMRISPRSWPGDGFLDILVMKGPKSDAFTTIPKVYRGEHLPHHNIMEFRTRSVRVEAERPLRIEADGEVLGTTPATFRIVPSAIQVKV
jgi:diacylglycerol kinase (ATP)